MTSTERLLKKLNRTATSLTNHVGRGNMLGGQRSQELVDRYHDLKAEALELNVWGDFCASRGYAADHDAYDFFA